MRHVLASYLRRGAALSLVFAVITAIGALALVGAPAFQRSLFDAETAHALEEMPEISRALQAQTTITSTGFHIPGPTLAEEFAPLVQITFPDLLNETRGPGEFSIETTEPLDLFSQAPIPPALKARLLSFIADSEAEAAVTMIEGTWPEAALANLTEGSIEAAISQNNAQIAGLNVGDELLIPTLFGMASVTISGIFSPLEPENLIWQVHQRALTPFIDDNPNSGKSSLGAAFINSEIPSWLGRVSQSQTYRARFPLHGTALQAEALADDLLTFTSARHQTIDGEPPLEFTSRLAEVLGELQAQRESAAAVLSTIVAGPLGAVVAVSILMALISRQRRSAEHALMTARGASSWQLRGLGAVEGLLVGVPALGIGWGFGAPLLGLGIALFPALALALAPLSASAKRRPRSGWLLGAFLVTGGMAAASYYVSSTLRGNDPLALILPVLASLTIAIGIIAIVPVVMRWLHHGAARGRGLLSFLGLARAAREQRAGWPIVALVIALSSALLASATLETITLGARANAFESVGADARLSTGGLTSERQEELSVLPGVTASAIIQAVHSTHVGSEDEHRLASLYVVDVDALYAAQHSAPGTSDLRDLKAAAPGEIPVLTSPGLFAADDPNRSVRIHEWLPIVVHNEATDVAGVTDSGAWMIIDHASLPDAARDALPLPRLMLFATDGEQATAEAIHDVGGGVVVTPLAALERFTASPVVSGLAVVAWSSLGFSAGLAALAIVLFLLLGSPQRRYTSGIVQILGGTTTGALTTWEVLPVAVGGILGGTLAGLILPGIATLDVRVFTGSDTAATAIINPGQVSLIIGIVAAAVLASIGVSALIQRRHGHEVLRMGD